MSNPIQNPGTFVLQLFGGIIVFFILIGVINHGLSIINNPDSGDFVAGAAMAFGGLGLLVFLGLQVLNRTNQGVTKTPTKEK